MHYQCMCCHFTFFCAILPKTTSSTSATVSDVFPRMPFTLTNVPDVSAFSWR